ncbi:hypothetical protein BH09ACT4_BH09ACT4_12680 [soil metagenome]
MNEFGDFDDIDSFDDDDDESPVDRRRRFAFAIAAVVFATVAIVPAIAIRIADPQDFRTGCWIHEAPQRLEDCLPAGWRP